MTRMSMGNLFQNLFAIRRRHRTSHAEYPRIFHFTRSSLGERSRIHLRLEPQGHGTLIVNANRIVHLNPTAAFMAQLILESTPKQKALRQLSRRYDAPINQLEQDYAQVEDQINELVRPDGACPIHELDLPTLQPFSVAPSAPYRMDLALTYRCNNDCAHCYNARERTFPEMDTSSWKRILSALWEIGIPHVVFTGGEPTLRDDLPELIAYAQNLGQITGLNTNGRRLSQPQFVSRLVEAGLDHVQITLESHLEEVHDRMVLTRGAWKQTVRGIQNALDSPLFVMTNTTLLKENSPFLSDTLEFLAKLGVPTIGLNALIYSGRGETVGTGLDERELAPLLEIAKKLTQEHQQRLIWYTPTQYCHFDPVELDLGIKGCTAARYNMCIEPDGGVIPCQSFYHPLGNILTNDWLSIWNHDLALALRARTFISPRCQECALVTECGGGCPLFKPASGTGI